MHNYCLLEVQLDMMYKMLRLELSIRFDTAIDDLFTISNPKAGTIDGVYSLLLPT